MSTQARLSSETRVIDICRDVRLTFDAVTFFSPTRIYRFAQSRGQVRFNVVVKADTGTVTAVTVNAAMRGPQARCPRDGRRVPDVLLNRCAGG